MVNLNKKNILIMGGTSFIAKNLIYKLDKKKYNLFIINYKKNQLSKIYPKHKFFDHNFIYPFIKKISFPKNLIVINLYGNIENKEFNKGGEKFIKDNFKIMLNIYKFLDTLNVLKLIHIASSDEYGLDASINSKNHNGYAVNSYGFSKLLYSNFFYMQFYNSNINLIILKLFLVYGPGQKFNRLIPFIIRSIIKKEKIKTTEGFQNRDFCHIDDVTNAIIKSINLNKKLSKPLIMDIGSGKSIKIKTVIDKIFNEFKLKKNSLVLKQYRKLERKTLIADNSKAKKYLNWKPEIKFLDGLKQTINYYVKKI